MVPPPSSASAVRLERLPKRRLRLSTDARRAQRGLSKRYWIFIPTYLTLFCTLHLLFYTALLIIRFGRWCARTAPHAVPQRWISKNRDALFEQIGKKLRSQIDLAPADQLGAGLQVVHNVSLYKKGASPAAPSSDAHSAAAASSSACTIKVPRHLAIVFARPDDSLLSLCGQVLQARLSPATHSLAQQREARLLRRQADLVQQTRKLIRWAALAGIEQISAYDADGLLKTYFAEQSSVKLSQRWIMPASARIEAELASQRRTPAPPQLAAVREEAEEGATTDSSLSSYGSDRLSGEGEGDGRASSSATSIVDPLELPAGGEEALLLAKQSSPLAAPAVLTSLSSRPAAGNPSILRDGSNERPKTSASDALKRSLLGLTAPTYQIEVELCLSGRHDVSSEAQDQRRRAAIERRRRRWAAASTNAEMAHEADAASATSSSCGGGVIPLHLTLNVLDATDGKDELANVAMDLYECVRDQTEEEMVLEVQEDAFRQGAQQPHHDGAIDDSKRQGGPGSSSERGESSSAQAGPAKRRRIRTLLLDRIDARKVDQALAERGAMGEPELLLIHGGPRKIALHGFPPWSLRLTELYHCDKVGSNEELTESDLLNALLQYSGSTQRYGR